MLIELTGEYGNIIINPENVLKIEETSSSKYGAYILFSLGIGTRVEESYTNITRLIKESINIKSVN